MYYKILILTKAISSGGTLRNYSGEALCQEVVEFPTSDQADTAAQRIEAFVSDAFYCEVIKLY